MRYALLAGVLVGVMAVEAQGQALPSPKPTNARSVQDSRFWSDVTLSRQITQARPPLRRMHYCCNLKHALIGAGVGAAVGLWFSRYCDGGNCGWETVKAVGIMGGIGAGLGAFVSRSNPGMPMVPMPSLEPTPSP